jgi:hypothetical protein
MTAQPSRLARFGALVLASACAMSSPRPTAPAAPVSAASPPQTTPADSSAARLARHVGFRQAIGDATRLHLIGGYWEERPGRLVLALDSAYTGASTVEYHLKRIYSAYGDYLNHNIAPVIELRLGGRPVGDYTWDGLALSGSSSGR